MAKSLRISLEHGNRRREKVEAAADLFDCGKSAAVMQCIEFSLRMAGDNVIRDTGNLERALKHEHMSEELAEILTTKQIQTHYEVDRDIRVGDE